MLRLFLVSCFVFCLVNNAVWVGGVGLVCVFGCVGARWVIGLLFGWCALVGACLFVGCVSVGECWCVWLFGLWVCCAGWSVACVASWCCCFGWRVGGV